MAATKKQQVISKETSAPAPVQSVADSAAIMAVIERVATNPDADISKLEKMLDMQERILNRNARAEFDAALAIMQSELPEVERLAEGHNSRYAKFEHILKAIKPKLQEHGFSITHRVNVIDGLVHVTGILSHRGGHREETTLPLPADETGNKNAVQAIASSTEYGRRYTMNSLLGIATKDADTDGGVPPELSQKAADWIAAVKECKDIESLKTKYTEAFNDLNGDEYGRIQLNAAKDEIKKGLK